MQEGRHACTNHLRRLQKIAASENVRLPRLVACCQRELRVSFGMLAPQLRDFFVGFAPLWHSGSPVAEDCGHLRRGALRSRSGEYCAHVPRQRVGNRAGSGGD